MTEKNSALHRPISPSGSLLLDIIRASAAVVVVIGHLALPSFYPPGKEALVKAATAAVVVFFLLSGFVIRYVTLRKPVTPAHYYVDRISRIYSVAIPAILLTLLFDLLSHRINPSYYDANWLSNCTHIPFRILANATFLSEIWAKQIFLLSNIPFWSLSFECFYYVLYGLAFYLTGAKRLILFVLVALLAGPSIMALFPLWLGGCLLYSLYQRLRGKRSIVIAMTAVIEIMALSLGLFHRALMPQLNAAQRWIDQAIPYSPLLGRVSIRFYEIGTVAFVLMLFLLLLADLAPVSGKSSIANAIRFTAEGTFPLYLFHFPILVLVFSIVGTSSKSLGLRAAILLGVATFAVLMGHPCNLLKLRMRAWLVTVLRIS
ncbi:acyltransferase family protein [Granulicella arctica]|uniref:Peptidoglycan/LPS O-acetylase OafA/YrhL n=1 Tax=Granulicella arctica TaxID=940613 RepID=A0A7Y9PH95_9BACT|nr:acyltransferase family protein [Granulicella arctica]NYF79098.1 peptidoglycan/LPS O-acetylase OafA/YrhL [Granulicella arctica]